MTTNQIFKFTIIIGLLFFNLSLVSCGSELNSMKEEFTESKNAIPSDFGKKGTVLVVVLQNEKYYDKLLKTCVNDNYKGEVVFVNSNELNSYSDKSKYNYLFDYSNGREYLDVHSTNGSRKTIKIYFIKDRTTNKMYQSKKEYKSYRNAIIAYMQNLEAKRLSNK
jgi:hypothetical protein